jgi:hypothetical protein
VEDLSADSAKIDSIFGKAKYLEGALTALVQVSYITDYDPNDKLLPDYMQTQQARDTSVAWKKVRIPTHSQCALSLSLSLSLSLIYIYKNILYYYIFIAHAMRKMFVSC